jgi:hypothetical protein
MDPLVEKIELRLDSMDTRLRNLEQDVASIKANYATKNDFAELRADMQKMHMDTTRWMLATVISLFLGFSGLFFVFTNSVKPHGQPSPIVIQVPTPAPSSTTAEPPRLPTR